VTFQHNITLFQLPSENFKYRSDIQFTADINKQLNDYSRLN